MSRNRIFSKPFDLVHSILYSEFPEEYLRSIGVPGKFVKKISRRVHLKDGTRGEMDSAFILEPDDEILFEKVASGLEHQSTAVGDEKLTKFGDYDIQLVVDENLPTFLMVASHLDRDESMQELVRSPSDITRIYFLNLGKENICERLSSVKEILHNNKHFTTEDALNLGIIALYAPRDHACEITEEVVNIYLEIVDDLDLDLESCLYSAITIMIDAFFDDENDYRRLKDMMDNKTSGESKHISEAHKSTIESLNYALEDLDETKSELDETNSKLDKTNSDLDMANDKIRDLEAEVKRLTEELNSK